MTKISTSPFPRQFIDIFNIPNFSGDFQLKFTEFVEESCDAFSVLALKIEGIFWEDKKTNSQTIYGYFSNTDSFVGDFQLKFREFVDKVGTHFKFLH